MSRIDVGNSLALSGHHVHVFGPADRSHRYVGIIRDFMNHRTYKIALRHHWRLEAM
jgi:hypothetical protein